MIAKAKLNPIIGSCFLALPVAFHTFCLATKSTYQILMESQLLVSYECQLTITKQYFSSIQVVRTSQTFLLLSWPRKISAHFFAAKTSLTAVSFSWLYFFDPRLGQDFFELMLSRPILSFFPGSFYSFGRAFFII